MKIRTLACLVACISLVAGCRKDSAQIAAQVKEEMQQEFTRKPGLKNLVVESVRLVAQSETDLTGVAVGSINGEYVKFDVDCKYDGTSVVWDADLSEGSLEDLRLKEAARDTYRLLKQTWPKVRKSIDKTCDAAAKSLSNGYDAAKKKAGELYEKAKAEAAKAAEADLQKAPDEPAVSAER